MERWNLGTLLFIVLAAGCSGRSSPQIELNTQVTPAAVDVVGLPAALLSELDRTRTPEEWNGILRVSVASEQPSMVGAWTVIDRRLRFTPMFPLDPGRSYSVAFTPPASSGVEPLQASVALPDRDRTPTTVVSATYPTAEIVPENQLRLYVHFSATDGTQGRARLHPPAR